MFTATLEHSTYMNTKAFFSGGSPGRGATLLVPWSDDVGNVNSSLRRTLMTPDALRRKERTDVMQIFCCAYICY